MQKAALFRVVLLTFLLAAVFAGGMLLGRSGKVPKHGFHDMRTTQTTDFMKLVDPADKEVCALAGVLRTPENAYYFVRDKILFEPSVSAVKPSQILAEGKASCLGKAVLLCSLYRCMGVEAANVRIVTGEIGTPSGPLDHAWVEMEFRNACLQQDPTDLLGTFSFDQFKGTDYSRAFVKDEEFCFNDEEFAVVSQLNRMRRVPIQSVFMQGYGSAAAR